jgi:hypothetical protein
MKNINKQESQLHELTAKVMDTGDESMLKFVLAMNDDINKTAERY